MSADDKSSSGPKKPWRISLQELVHQLSRGLGEERAETVITAAAQYFKFEGMEFDRKQAAAILDRLAASTGVVGTVARFAKARIALDIER